MSYLAAGLIEYEVGGVGGANPAFRVCLCADSYGKLHLGSEGMWAHAGCITEATGVYKSSEMTPPLSL